MAWLNSKTLFYWRTVTHLSSNPAARTKATLLMLPHRQSATYGLERLGIENLRFLPHDAMQAQRVLYRLRSSIRYVSLTYLCQYGYTDHDAFHPSSIAVVFIIHIQVGIFVKKLNKRSFYKYVSNYISTARSITASAIYATAILSARPSVCYLRHTMYWHRVVVWFVYTKRFVDIQMRSLSIGRLTV